MNRLCLRGGIRTTQFGDSSVYLFPQVGEGPNAFKHLESPQLKRILLDHFDFFRGDVNHGKVHGTSVTINRTKKDGRKIMKFSVGFLEVTLLEEVKVADGSKAILFLELPFHDPATLRETVNA